MLLIFIIRRRQDVSDDVAGDEDPTLTEELNSEDLTCFGTSYEAAFVTQEQHLGTELLPESGTFTQVADETRRLF
jgi:hypothetical protein